MADTLGCESIALPAIATGSFSFPKKKCAQVMIDCVVDYVNTHAETTMLKEIKLINIDMKTVYEFIGEFDKRFQPEEIQ